MKNINIRLKLSVIIFISIIPWIMLFSLPVLADQIWFFSVGEGDAIYIQTRQGNRILIDGGPDNTILSKLSSRIPWWDKHIDLVIVTHYHEDHIAGLIQVLEQYQVGRIILPQSDYQSPVRDVMLGFIDKKQISNTTYEKQDLIKSGGAELRCLWQESNTTDPNEGAYIFLLNMNQFKYLLTSDVEFTNFSQKMLTSEIGDIDLIKVPHQGSKNSLNQIVLDTIKPELAIISVGKNNYGHPNQDMIDLLGKNNILVYRTDKDGDIMINTINMIQRVSKYK